MVPTRTFRGLFAFSAPGCAGLILGSAPAVAAGPAVPTLTWQDCGGGIQCATARVPLDYDKPNGRQIRLAVTRRPATRASQRIGSLFFNPGGPGGPGTDEIRRSRYDTLNQRFDLIGFDPRGIGESRPAIHCASDRVKDSAFRNLPTLSTSNFDRYLKRADRLAAECRKHTPKSFIRHVSTADTARDMDLLRRAVGDPKLSYLGFSYGTELGAQYASLFPNRVRALALDGGVDHLLAVRDPLRFTLSGEAGSEAALSRFFGFCNTSPSKCPFANGHPRSSFDDIIAQLRSKPLDRGSSLPLDDAVARVGVFQAMYAQTAWPLLGSALADARKGNPALIEALANALLGRDGSGHYDNFLDANVVILANDAVEPRARAPYKRHLGDVRKVAPHFADFSFLSDAIERTLPSGQDAYRKPLKYPKSAPPVLVIGSTGDNATPYARTRSLAKQLGNARLLTRVGNGHTGYPYSQCVRNFVNAYLIDGTLPPAGTRCQSDPIG